MGLKLNSNNIKINKINSKPTSRKELAKEISNHIKRKEYDFNDIDTSYCDDFRNIFANTDIVEIDVSTWNTSNVINMNSMFDGCNYLKKINGIENFDVSNVKSMSFMFNDCINLIDVGDLSNWKLNNNIRMKYAFQNCKKLKTIGDITSWKLIDANWEVFPLSSIKPLPTQHT